MKMLRHNRFLFATSLVLALGAAAGCGGTDGAAEAGDEADVSASNIAKRTIRMLSEGYADLPARLDAAKDPTEAAILGAIEGKGLAGLEYYVNTPGYPKVAQAAKPIIAAFKLLESRIPSPKVGGMADP